LANDKNGLKQEKAMYEKTIVHFDKDKKLLLEMIDKLKGEKIELQRQVFSLKKRGEDTERKLFDSKLQLRQYERATKAKKEKPLSDSSSVNKFGSDLSQKLGSEPAPTILPESEVDSKEPRPGNNRKYQEELPGLHYLIRFRILETQD
jgi:hypothetical protein